jgi:hypothetical protein
MIPTGMIPTGVRFAGAKFGPPLAGVRAIGLADQLGPERLLVNARKAIRQFQERSAGALDRRS